ncbi:MAG: transposase [Zoogloeaceae bacterium]|jgi:putative transposase|nr:transposase [Zoogloeaceae bacterium]
MKLSGIPQHIVQRGINREPCFFADEDYQCYLHWLWKSAADWHCGIHAYVLMTNHVHLLVTPECENSIEKLMQSIGRRYVQYINRQYKRTGTLWEGRYKSSLIQAEDYLLACMRYIELNPVRAGMVEDPVNYPWSSYRANGLGKPSEHLAPHLLYLALGQDTEGRASSYRKLFRPQLDDEAIADIRQAINQGTPLGSERFKNKVSVMTGVRRTLPKRGRPAREGGQPADGEQIGFGF